MLIAEELERMVRQSLLDICRTCSCYHFLLTAFTKHIDLFFSELSAIPFFNGFKLILTLQETSNNFLCRADWNFHRRVSFLYIDVKRGKTFNACDVPRDNFLKKFLMQIMLFYELY
jgi:hypothetical protein